MDKVQSPSMLGRHVGNIQDFTVPFHSTGDAVFVCSLHCTAVGQVDRQPIKHVSAAFFTVRHCQLELLLPWVRNPMHRE